MSQPKPFSCQLCTVIGVAANLIAGLLLVIGFSRLDSLGGVAWVIVIVAGREIGRNYKVLYQSTKNLIANVTFIALILTLSFGLFLGISSLVTLLVMLTNLISWDSQAVALRMNGLPNSADVRRMIMRHYLLLTTLVILSIGSFYFVNTTTLTLSVWTSILIAAIAVLALILILRHLLGAATNR